jgi:hypothetical protein
MCGHVAKAAQDFAVQEAALAALTSFAGLAGPNVSTDAESAATSAFWWCKTFVKFVHHESILRRRLGEAGHLQGLISPEVLVRMERPEGDCAIFSECVCAFLRVFGVPYEFVTVAVNAEEPEVFSHVYVYAVMPDGSRLPIDASHGAYPGWQVPSSDVFRRQVWDAAGNPVQDRGSRFTGLHSYGLRGMGQADDIQEGGTYQPPPPVPSSEIGTFTTGDPLTPSWWGSYSPSSSSSSSSGGFNWGGFLGNLANQWTQIGGRVIAPTTTYQRDANGNIIYTTPGQAAPPTAITSSGSSLLLMGGLAVGALLLFSMGRK